MEVTNEQMKKIETLKKSILDDFIRISEEKDVKEITRVIFHISNKSNELAIELQHEQMSTDKESFFLT